MNLSLKQAYDYWQDQPGFFSFFRNLIFAHGPAVDNFFTQEMVKIAQGHACLKD